ncbi:hypothetical protein VN97_g9038 [Penicillium thymicola]|uniref:Uncharacterized protein n=1 Tax=Penicillium thymicola TaxID=293382 RepID=A0AAI9X588_PENTH|nr:hypothetical protein VN97_g9038 [Penicillium thymicola]
MLFLDLKHFGGFDTSTVYGQSRSGTVAVALWLCGCAGPRFGAWIIRPSICTKNSLSFWHLRSIRNQL